jgi:hypothetical protein
MAVEVNKQNNQGKGLYRFAFKCQSCGKPREAPSEVLFLVCLFSSVALAKPTAQQTRLVLLDSFFQWKARKSPNKHPLSTPYRKFYMKS